MAKGVSEGRDYWAEVMAEFNDSGLTQATFAMKKGISKWTLRAWVIRLRDEAEPKLDRLDDILVEAARRRGGLTSGEVATAVGVTTGKAREFLHWLVEEGRLVKTGKTRSTKYVVPDG